MENEFKIEASGSIFLGNSRRITILGGAFSEHHQLGKSEIRCQEDFVYHRIKNTNSKRGNTMT